MPRPVTVRAEWRGRPVALYTRPWKMSDDNVIREVLGRHAYERHGVALARSRHWLDCGAHIGTFALAAALEGCRVDSFEPHPENAQYLRRNLARNGLARRVRVHEAALVSRPRVATMELHLAPRSTSFHSLTTPFRDGQSVDVRVEGFERFLREHPDVDGVKMDVEGSEMPLLESLVRSPRLLGRLTQLVFEWDFKHDPETARLRRVVRALEGAGFEVRTRRDVFRKKRWEHWPSGVLVWAWRPENDSPSASSSSS